MTINLKARRLNKGLSLRVAARKMGIGANTLARAEDGHSVHPSSAFAIARFYGLNVTDIWPIDGQDRTAA